MRPCCDHPCGCAHPAPLHNSTAPLRCSYSDQLGKWIEVGNSGMFRPEMLRPMGLPEGVNVIAWGLGLERPTMILYRCGMGGWGACQVAAWVCLAGHGWMAGWRPCRGSLRHRSLSCGGAAAATPAACCCWRAALGAGALLRQRPGLNPCSVFASPHTLPLPHISHTRSIDNIRDLFGHKVSLSMVKRNPICRLGL